MAVFNADIIVFYTTNFYMKILDTVRNDILKPFNKYNTNCKISGLAIERRLGVTWLKCKSKFELALDIVKNSKLDGNMVIKFRGNTIFADIDINSSNYKIYQKVLTFCYKSQNTTNIIMEINYTI